MATKTICHCDRCGKEVVGKPTELEVRRNGMKAAEERLELCSNCEKAFRLWMETGR